MSLSFPGSVLAGVWVFFNYTWNLVPFALVLKAAFYCKANYEWHLYVLITWLVNLALNQTEPTSGGGFFIMMAIWNKVNEKRFFEQFMQHRCHTINQDVSTRGSLSAEQLKNEGEGANKY